MIDGSAIQDRISAEMAAIADPIVVRIIRQLLVQPRCELREWEYGSPGQSFPCWIVLEHPPSNTCIAYCEHGFGPVAPWGMLFTTGRHLSMGMDSNWFSFFEDAFRESPAWDGENPAEYEVR